MRELPALTLKDLLERSIELFGPLPALSMVDGKPIRYAELGAAAARASRLLSERGVGRGDKVVILSENRPEWGISYFAVTCMGAVAVPILTDFTVDQIANIVAHSEATLAFASAKHRDRLPAGFPVIDIDGLDEGFPAADGPLPERPIFPGEAAEGDMAAIIYTSGTTGHSKGVCLSHKNIVSDCIMTIPLIRLGPKDRALSILPLAHTYECTIGFVNGIMQGMATWYMDKPPAAASLLPVLARVRPTIMLTVPLVIEKIYRSKVRGELEKHGLYRNALGRKLLTAIAGMKLRKTFGGQLRFFGVGGAPLAADVEAFLLEARFPYAIGYGLTETAPLIAGAAVGKTKVGSTGPALRGLELRIADPSEGGSGEIQVRGPNVMMGYYKDEARTRETFTEDGWFRTGDLGEIDAEGSVHVRGRLKTMILGASGENIYPEEIEAVLNQSELVGESLVYGDAGKVEALVLLKPEALEKLLESFQGSVHKAEHAIAALLENIKKEVNSKLASFSKIARIKHQAEPFEKTPTQKIKRFRYPAP